MADARRREVALWKPEIAWEERPDGSILVWRDDPLQAYPPSISARFVYWAETAPERVWIAARDGRGGWRKVTYGEGLALIRSIGQALLHRGLGVERPLLILAENSIEHALMALGAQHVGIPSAAVTPAYARADPGFGKLAAISAQMTPGLVFVEDGAAFADAVTGGFGAEMPVVHVRDPARRSSHETAFADLAATPAGPDVDRAHAAVGPDTIAKFLFTSGTTGAPKAVIQTQRMLCANQAQIADCYAFLTEAPPVIVDWAPWTHTASGNKVFNIVIHHGGTFYIDNGKPTPGQIGETIANLREIAPTWYFNVPAGYEMLVEAMRDDALLRESFFRDLKMAMYAGASMAQHTWDALLALSESVIGARVLVATGLGATETSPFSLFCTEHQERPGNIGIPARGITLKLVPVEDKYELRLKGPNVTPGYWRDPDLTRQAFDEEGFYRIGDAVRMAVPGDPARGFFFEGRTAENFKLRTGTWVSVGKLRAALVDRMGGLIRDAVITGEDRHELGALVVPFYPALRALVPDGAVMSETELAGHPAVRAALAARLADHQAEGGGSSIRIRRLLVLTEPPRLDRGEITDKGSLNQRAIRTHRADMVEHLYAGGPDVILAFRETTP
jgi:feruloyl-CoA synthase